jgi:signal peptidase
MAGQKIIETKSSLFVLAPEERIVVGPRIWYTRMNNAFRWSGYALAIVLMSFSVLSFSGTVKARVVLTGSMIPTINPGDIILTTPAKNVSPKVGSIVAYVGRRFDGTAVGVFSHRIIGGDATSGFIVKGDHNPTPDTQRPKIPDITGVVIFVIPIIGRFLTPKALMITVPLVFGLWLIFDALKND